MLTSEVGAARLAGTLPASATIVAVGDTTSLDPSAAVEVLRGHGHQLILCEGGPTVFGALTAVGLVDELFLTLSPLLAGRADGDARLSLLEGAELMPGRTAGCTLLALRRAGSHLFLRYELPTREADSASAEVRQDG